MRHGLILLLTTVTLACSACTGSDAPEIHGETRPELQPKSETVVPAVPQELSGRALATADYTIIDPTVRKALTYAGQDFTIRIRDGAYTFPTSVLIDDFRNVTVDTDDVVYGDLTGDGIPDAIVKVTIGQGDMSMTELAAFTASGGTARQFAAFPLGHADVNSVDITSGKIRVNFVHTVLGDPGTRNTQLMLELPKK